MAAKNKPKKPKKPSISTLGHAMEVTLLLENITAKLVKIDDKLTNCITATNVTKLKIDPIEPRLQAKLERIESKLLYKIDALRNEINDTTNKDKRLSDLERRLSALEANQRTTQ